MKSKSWAVKPYSERSMLLSKVWNMIFKKTQIGLQILFPSIIKSSISRELFSCSQVTLLVLANLSHRCDTGPWPVIDIRLFLFIIVVTIRYIALPRSWQRPAISTQSCSASVISVPDALSFSMASLAKKTRKCKLQTKWLDGTSYPGASHRYNVQSGSCLPLDKPRGSCLKKGLIEKECIEYELRNSPSCLRYLSRLKMEEFIILKERSDSWKK